MHLIKIITTLFFILLSLTSFEQVLNETEGEIQSSTLSGSGNRNVISDSNGILKIDSDTLDTYYFSQQLSTPLLLPE